MRTTPEFKKLAPIFRKAAKAQADVNDQNHCCFSCWTIQVTQGQYVCERSGARQFYEDLFGCQDETFIEMAPDLSDEELNEIRVLTLLFAAEVAKNP